MSVEPVHQDGAVNTAELRCGICEEACTADAAKAVHCYASDPDTAPQCAAADGFIGVCGDCDTEVADLLEAWTPSGDPPVGTAPSIIAAYDRSTGACSFCERDLETVAMGAEYFPLATGTREIEASNFALCGGCTDVFERFLTQVRAHATD
jgi:hypothetical protein